MKKEPRTTTIRKTLALLAVALVATACQSELNQPEETAPATGQKVTLTIRATQGGTDSDNTPQTRTTYTDGLSEDGSIFVKWEATGEAIKVLSYNPADEALNEANGTIFDKTSTRSPDGKSITFTGEVTEAANYVALYPADGWKWDKWFKRFNYRSKEQIQDCTKGNEMKHLKNNDFMVGIPVAGSNSAFTFEHKSTILRFDLTLSEAAKVNKVTLSSSYAHTIETDPGVELDEDSLLIKYHRPASSISLGIKNHDGTDELKAYLVVGVLDMGAGQTLIITAETDKGSYVGTLDITQDTMLESGKCYTLKSTLVPSEPLTVEGFTPGELKAALAATLATDKYKKGMTKLVIKGEVAGSDISVVKPEEYGSTNALSPFLEENITFIEVDLSQVTGLTAIEGSFMGCGSLISVNLPTTGITSIGKNAFYHCTGLTTLTLPESVTSIGKEAFNSCNFTTITLPSGVTNIGNGAFVYCTSLTTITLPASVTSIGFKAFADCSDLQSILFEGTFTAVNTAAQGNQIQLGTNATDKTIWGSELPSASLKLFLPAITDPTVAGSYYGDILKKVPVYYHYNKGDYNNATPDEKVDVNNYTIYPTN